MCITTDARFICYLLVWEWKAEKDSLSCTIPLGNIFLCLSQIHTQYLLRHFPIKTRFEQFHDSLHPTCHYLQQNLYFLIGITETHQGFHVTQLKFTVHYQKVYQANILGSGCVLRRKTCKNHQDRMMDGFWIILQLKSSRELSNRSSTV